MKSFKLLSAMCFLPFLVIASDDVCDQQASKKAFSKCAACHSANEGGPTLLGPNLFDVVGRKSASVKGFPYSPALNEYNKIWTEQELHTFLEKPMKVVPGTMMAFGGLRKVSDRNAVICFLKKNSNK